MRAKIPTKNAIYSNYCYDHREGAINLMGHAVEDFKQKHANCRRVT